jgi:hypothetical protein
MRQLLLILLLFILFIPLKADESPPPIQTNVEYTFRDGMDCQGNLWHERTTTITYSNGTHSITVTTYIDSTEENGYVPLMDSGQYGGCSIEWF